MYEFTKKEIREQFKKTEYGKKTTRMLYMSIIVTAMLFTASILFNILLDKTTMNSIILIILNTLTSVAFIISCYFDGKRDGAIEQFKINKK